MLTVPRMMATLLRIGILAVTVIIPGGFLLLTLYLATRPQPRGPALDFADGHRRVPRLKQPPPSGPKLRKLTRRLHRSEPVSLAG